MSYSSMKQARSFIDLIHKLMQSSDRYNQKTTTRPQVCSSQYYNKNFQELSDLYFHMAHIMRRKEKMMEMIKRVQSLHLKFFRKLD